MSDFFPKDAAKIYDEKNSKLSAISENLHFLIRLVLQDMPPQSRILCIGVGTGAEILSLSKAFPEWSFVGADPSAPMLEVCEERLKAAGVWSRCRLVHGYVHDLPGDEKFDAVLSVLVAHFVKKVERLQFYQEMTKRLKAGGLLVNAEISYDCDSKEFGSMIKNWERVQKLMGATPESIANLPKQLRELLTIMPPAETEAMLRKSGIEMPVRFFQAFMIAAWYGKKA